MSGRIKSKPKLQVIEFLKETREMDEYSFVHYGTETEARSFIHRMRVELSRMRDVVREAGRVPREFKMLVVELEYDAVKNQTLVKLRKADGPNTAIAEEINEIFNDIAAGEAL